MVGSEAICHREQCRYMGPLPEPPNLAGRVAGGATVALLFHFGCFPLFFLFPITFPLMVLVWVARLARLCPACRTGQLIPTDTPRGQALKQRLEQSTRL